MLIRLWHWLYRHNWRERDVVFNPPNGELNFIAWTDYQHHCERGFTDITLICDCGALKIHRLIGKHTGTVDADIDALRKMAGLK